MGRRHPDWLKVRIPSGREYHSMISLLASSRLHTICEEADCPNIAECFKRSMATFLILGDICTRSCTYCNIKKGTPRKIDPEEPIRIAKLVKKLNLGYVVITSVTRDDLTDGGAGVFAQTIQAIKNLSPETKIEVLIPDFKGDRGSLERVMGPQPFSIAHNLETGERLFPTVRPQGDYRRSLNLLKKAKEMSSRLLTKSGIMVGMGERKEEIVEAMEDLREAGCDIFTIGQYLQPSLKHLPISRYYSPEEFKEFKKIGEGLGFLHIESGPLVRSSYHAGGYMLNHFTPTRC